MKENVLPSLKLVYKPLIMYYGEWELGDDFEYMSLNNKGKNLFEQFLDRYYYLPLNVIFKDEDLVKSFKYGICSKLVKGRRTLFFSSRIFWRNIISNIDDILDSNGEKAYKDIKKAIRIKKDMYRDFLVNGEKSEYFDDLKHEYKYSKTPLTFEDYVKLCKKKYTRLLSGYNAILEFFQKPINVDKFISCFDPEQLYLYTCYKLLLNSRKYYEAYGKIHFNINSIDSFKTLVDYERINNPFYNKYISVKENKERKIYTLDDLFSDYAELLSRINK